MAAPQNPYPFFKLLPFLLILFKPHHSFAQSPSSSQNIQTFYPFSPPPPPSVDRIPPPRRTSVRAAVGRAIAVTAATTILLSGLFFFLLLRRFRQKKPEPEGNGMAGGGGTDPSDGFTRFNGNIKGLIVDENGLDVLYWRNLEGGGESGAGFVKQYYGDRPEVEHEKRMVSGRGRKSNSKPPTQEVPLLRGKSSTSQSPIWAEDDDRVMRKEVNLSAKMPFSAMEKQGSSIQFAPPPPPPLHMAVEMTVEKQAPPPPPPPPQMGTEKQAPPPPPPPPEHMAMAMEKQAAAPQMTAHKKTTPPPLPPMLPNKSPAPPPAPHKRSSVDEGTSSNYKTEQVKLKPLHWDKVNPAAVDHSMVWDKIEKGSFRFDGDLMEALFGYVATNRKSPVRDTQSPEPVKSGLPEQIFILDTRKSQNTAIVLKSLGVTCKEIIDALVNRRGGLNPDTLEKLTRIAPSDQEASLITTFRGDPTRLADAESFLYHLLKSVPSAFERLKAMFFRSNHESEVNSVKESLKTLELACNELRIRGLFTKLLEAVLKAGNRLNAGTSRGNAQAFNLTALRKLSDIKSSDGKTTLLEFVVQEVVRAEGKRCVRRKMDISGSQSPEQSKDDQEREYMMLGLPLIGGLSTQFSNVQKAAALDYDLLAKSIAALSEQVDEVRESVSRCGNDGFVREMKGFLDTAELEAKVVMEEEVRVADLVRKTTDYYQAGGLTEKGLNSKLLLFVIVWDFLGMVDRVCIEIARNVQKKKLPPPASNSDSGSSSSGLPRVFRFPKLPANFMSDNSRIGTDDDSETR